MTEPDDINKVKTSLILDEIKRRSGEEKIVDVEEEKVKVVIFSLLNVHYAFYGADIKEILPPAKIFYIPGSPDFILGVINVRGDIESVINPNRFLGIPDSETTHFSRITVAEKNSIKSGVLVDSVEDVLDVPVSSIKPPLSTLNKPLKDYVTGELIYKNKNVTILDVGKIFEKIVA